MTAIYGELIYLLDLKNELQIAFAGILMLLPSVKMYAQVYVWTAGFQNYIVPIFLYLTAILCWKKGKEAKKKTEEKFCLELWLLLQLRQHSYFPKIVHYFLQLLRLVSGQWKSGKIRRSDKVRSYWQLEVFLELVS